MVISIKKNYWSILPVINLVAGSVFMSIDSLHVGNQTIWFRNQLIISSHYSVVGDKEGKGPYGMYFDQVEQDPLIGGDTWEEAESNLVSRTVTGCALRGGFMNSPGGVIEGVDYIVGGDLLSQLIATTWGVASFNRPFLGVYSACASLGEAMLVGGMITDGGYGNRVLCVSSSHFGAAEKQFRAPLNYGAWRTLTSTSTITGAGALVIERLDSDLDSGEESGTMTNEASKGKVYVKGATIGTIVDYGIKDSSNMGAAMAAAAYKTIVGHFKDTDKLPGDYDLIVTGDLGRCGSDILAEMCANDGYDIKSRHFDCGDKIYIEEEQDTHAGGSGPGCSASMLCGYFIRMMEEGYYKNILFVPTGALLSAVSYKEGKSIPSIAHGIILSSERGK